LLIKTSEKTNTLARRANRFFWPLWIGVAVYFGLRSLGIISADWDKWFFLIYIPSFVIVFGLIASVLISGHQDSKKSQHSDPDVAALIDGEIDITQYRLRKEAAKEVLGLKP
jgi:uncharacterized membrane protein